MEFEEFPKMARLSREVIITEKLDGTNGQIAIEELDGFPAEGALYQKDGLALWAGSRSRWVTPGDDNYGVAKWALENAEELLLLGPGRHFGEWWGQGIQRNYNQPRKRFSLFNVVRWGESRPACCDVVPTLWVGQLEEHGMMKGVKEALNRLQKDGSAAAPGFMNPEGIVLFHTAANFGFKKTLHKDEVPKAIAKDAA